MIQWKLRQRGKWRGNEEEGNQVSTDVEVSGWFRPLVTMSMRMVE